MRPKKQLGQNFLTNPRIAEKLVLEAHVQKSDTVLEIGPGQGMLTEILLATAKNVVAIEKDRELIPLLTKKFKTAIKKKKLELLEGDALTFNTTLLKKYKLVANIPYYITGEIIRTYLENQHPPETMALMVQKEVAERIVARDGKESLLSLSVKVYGTPRIVGSASRNNFFPAPNVDSSLLVIDQISKKRFKKIEEKVFFTLLRKGFAHKRKQLVGNLKSEAKKETIETSLKELELPLTARPESLSIDQWVLLVEKVGNPQKSL